LRRLFNPAIAESEREAAARKAEEDRVIAEKIASMKKPGGIRRRL
jgi:hypothetical protein